jgi:DNA-binding MarR family transcriptional regulator
MVLLFLDKHSELTQKEIAALIFKDNASMTRMINLMVNKEYLKRSMNKVDRRRFTIEITAKGKKILETLPPIILSNREKSIEGITKKEIIQLETILKKITTNCINS